MTETPIASVSVFGFGRIWSLTFGFGFGARRWPQFWFWPKLKNAVSVDLYMSHCTKSNVPLLWTTVIALSRERREWKRQCIHQIFCCSGMCSQWRDVIIVVTSRSCIVSDITSINAYCESAIVIAISRAQIFPWKILPNSLGQFAKFRSLPWQNHTNSAAHCGLPLWVNWALTCLKTF